MTSPFRVALTFDAEHPDRPHRIGVTARILSALAGADVRASFFLQGRWVEANRELARDIAPPAPRRQPLLLPCPDAAAEPGRAGRRRPRPSARSSGTPASTRGHGSAVRSVRDPRSGGPAALERSATATSLGRRRGRLAARPVGAAMVRETLAAAVAHGDGAVVLLHTPGRRRSTTACPRSSPACAMPAPRSSASTSWPATARAPLEDGPRRRWRQLEDRRRPCQRGRAAAGGRPWRVGVAPGRRPRGGDGAAGGVRGGGPHAGGRDPRRMAVPTWRPTRSPAPTRHATCDGWRDAFASRAFARTEVPATMRSGPPERDRPGLGRGDHLRRGVGARGGPDGRTARLDALGAFSGDWGGGTDVGWAAVAAAVRDRDGRGPRTSLARIVPAHFGPSLPGGPHRGPVRRTDPVGARARALGHLRGGRRW